MCACARDPAMRWRPRPVLILVVTLLAPALAGCIDVPDGALGAAAASGAGESREVELLRESVSLDPVTKERTLDVAVPEGAQRVRVAVTIDGAVNRLTWSGPGERCAGHAGLYVSQGTTTTASDCDAPPAGAHPLKLRIRDGAATLDVVVTAQLAGAPADGR